jgi:uncharacterized protein YhaN
MAGVCVAELLSLAVHSPAIADTIYKTVDREGRVTYSSSPPKAGERGATAVELKVDPDRNVIPAEKTPQIEQLEQVQREQWQEQRLGEQREQRDRRERIADAEEELRAAEEALREGQVTQPGDFLGRKDGGVRPSPQRFERLDRLQQAVERARENLEAERYRRD